MIIHIVRALYLLVVLAFTISYAFQRRVVQQGATYVTLYILIPVVAAFALVMVDMFWRKKRLQALSGLFFGMLAGLIIAYGLAQIVSLAGNVFAPPTTVTTQKNEQEATTTVKEAQQKAREIIDKANVKADKIIAEARAETTTQPEQPESGIRESKSKPGPIVTAKGDALGPALDLIKVLLGASAVFLCVTIVMQTKDDFRFVIPYVEFSKQIKGARQLFLDTSVIIDGRIGDISETGILESEIVVPRFILAELQSIADSDDKLRRNRGRRGLDVLNRLRSSKKIDIQILDAHIQSVDDAPDVDTKLVAICEHFNARIVTNDYNLNKIAQLRGLDVININDLANALKPIVLPGETMDVKIIKPGEEAGQGVGYLEDGTMVVAEQGRDYVGREIVITVTSVLQTSAGRMIFGKLNGEKTLGPREKRT